MKKILLIEDDGYLAAEIIGKLNNYDIKKATSYNAAIGMWIDYSEDFECIILDLNIDPEGLESKEREDYFSVPAILILLEFGKNKDGTAKSLEEQKAIWEKTVVFSDFIKNLPKEGFLKNPPGTLTYISKGDHITSVNELVKKVNEIVNK